jgi:ABC-type multidrug transport system fused ATPase/permease subunit
VDDSQQSGQAHAELPPWATDGVTVGVATESTSPAIELLDDSDDTAEVGAAQVLRRGIKASPELRDGLVATVFMGLAVAVGRLTVPIIIQLALDTEVLPDGSMDTSAILRMAAVALAVILAAAVIGWLTQRRLVERAEEAIANLRVRAFNHIHRLSVADHNDTKRGVLVARVTSDAESLARFAQWGLFSWTINPALILGILLVLAVYSWQLALVVLVAYAPVVPALSWIQKRQMVAYDTYRTRVGEMLSAFSEAVMGAAVIRAYGAEARSRRGIHYTIDRRYSARMTANRYMAMIFVAGDAFGAMAFIAVLATGLWQRESWGLEPGVLVACLFLTTMLNGPIADLAETMDQTQTAAAGWRKILNLLDHPIDIIEPSDGVQLSSGPIEIAAEGVDFSYRDGGLVLDQVEIVIPAGTKVAVVGQTGSGKTTFAKLLCRLADPTGGRITLNGADLRDVAPESRMSSVRMVPQDGFLFDATIGENVTYGASGSITEDAVASAFEALDLGWWLKKLPDGVATEVGERGENLSVGERQLVALARAQLADPGLLVLDEATSAVDPETDQALTHALRRLAEGRTLVSVAHRLATAEAADLVLVFDKGRLVEYGPHHVLVADGGIYSELHRAWIGNTRTDGERRDPELPANPDGGRSS